MSGENPASKPTPVQDVQGDGRWMSLVSDPARDAQESEVEMGGSGVNLIRGALPDWETEGSWGDAKEGRGWAQECCCH